MVAGQISNCWEKASIFKERFREIVSDPLNLLIDRVPQAGYIDQNGCVILHNGNRVPISGKYAYYKDFSDILVVNRGVHEPLEEFCFQTLLSRLNESLPSMLELGAYWAHYSMWLKKSFPDAYCVMVEPDRSNLACGKNNFSLNGYDGKFINEAVGSNHWMLDKYAYSNDLQHLDILHADIQGYEVEMLHGANRFLAEHRADYIFISTHSEELHQEVCGLLEGLEYRVEISSPVITHTTSGDGFVFASSPKVNLLFDGFEPIGRIDISRSNPTELIDYIGKAKAFVHSRKFL